MSEPTYFMLVTCPVCEDVFSEGVTFCESCDFDGVRTDLSNVPAVKTRMPTLEEQMSGLDAMIPIVVPDPVPQEKIDALLIAQKGEKFSRVAALAADLRLVMDENDTDGFGDSEAEAAAAHDLLDAIDALLSEMGR